MSQVPQKFEYIKRYQMNLDLRDYSSLPIELPESFVWIPWHPQLVEVHARTLYLSFRNELDAQIFPSFRQYESCMRLLHMQGSEPQFLSETAWLIARKESPTDPLDYCAAIYGSREGKQTGMIQNVSVRSEYRRRGFGRAIVLQAIEGFKKSGCQRVFLEVSAKNESAVQLYQKTGFKIVRTSFREIYCSR